MGSKSIKKNWPYILIAVLAVVLVASLAWAASENLRANDLSTKAAKPYSQEDAIAKLEEHGITPLNTTQASNSQTTADELAYLIEEEKLAHDVYQAMYDKWGSRVFGNIMNSEMMHQNMVWAVMESRGLADPRKTEMGQFVNQDLQNLYDKLVAQGDQSELEAFKAGVIVEETDIADLKQTLEKLDARDMDVKDVLENLLHASENHLRAFNRQVSR